MIRRNLFSLLVALVIAYLSLSEADKYDKKSFLNFTGADKVAHVVMYFGLMSVMVYENRKRIGKVNILFLAGIIPLSYGGLMELMQAWFTQTRSASVADMLFDLAGILLSVILFLIIRPLRRHIII